MHFEVWIPLLIQPGIKEISTSPVPGTDLPSPSGIGTRVSRAISIWKYAHAKNYVFFVPVGGSDVGGVAV